MMTMSRWGDFDSATLCRSLHVFQNLQRSQASVRAHDAAARVSRRTTHVEILDRRAVLRPAGDWTQKEKLLQRKLALENVALAQSPFAFQIEWRNDLLVKDDVFDVWSIFGNGVDDGIAESFFLIIPVQPGTQLVRRVLHEAGQHMLSRRRHRRISQRRNHHVNIRMPGKVPVLRVVISSLHVFDGGGNRNRAAQVSAWSGHALKVRQRVKSHVDFAGRAAKLEPVHLFEKVAGQVLGFNKLGEREARIYAGRNDVGIKFVAVHQHDSLGFAALYDNSRNTGLGADLDSCLAGGVGDGIRNRAGPSACEAPGAKRAVDLAHVVMEQNVSSSRRTHAQERSDDA